MSEPIHGTQPLDKIVVEIDIRGVRAMDPQDVADLDHLICHKLIEAGIPVKMGVAYTPRGARNSFIGVHYGHIEGQTIAGTRVVTWYRNLIIH